LYWKVQKAHCRQTDANETLSISTKKGETALVEASFGAVKRQVMPYQIV
jgi:hypothetical protein